MSNINFKKMVIHERPNGSILFCESAAVFKPFLTIKRKMVGNKIKYYRNGKLIKDILNDEYMIEYIRRSLESPIRYVPQFSSINEDLKYRIVDVFDSKLDKEFFPKYKGYIQCYQVLLKSGRGEYTYIPVDTFHKTTKEKHRNKIICQLINDKAPYKLIEEMSGLSRMQIHNICKKKNKNV
jgi:hypothetical protein